MSYSIDVNVLLYASDRSSPRHDAARGFLEACAGNQEVLCLTWPTLMAYLRIATHPAIFAAPLAPDDALTNVRALLALPHVRVVSERDGFLDAYAHVTDGVVVRGNLGRTRTSRRFSSRAACARSIRTIGISASSSGLRSATRSRKAAPAQTPSTTLSDPQLMKPLFGLLHPPHHRDLAIRHLAQGAAVLSRHAARMRSRLGEAGFVKDSLADSFGNLMM